MSRMTRLKALGVTAFAVIALTAIAAQGASAATWTTANPFITGQAEDLKESLGLAAGGIVKGSASGYEVELSVAKMEAIAPSRQTKKTTAYIEQGLEGTTHQAWMFGRLRFTSLKLVKPTGCGPPTEVLTANIKGTVTSGTPTYLNIEPTSGTTELATFELTGTCAIAGVPIKLSTTSHECLKIASLGTMSATMPLSTSPEILKGCGGSFFAAGLPAELTFSGSAEVATGVSWGADSP